MSDPAAPRIRRWTVARDRNNPERNEDASRAELVEDADAWRALLVVADGAGSTPFAGEWAHALVDAADPKWAQDGGLARGVDGVRRTFDPLADLTQEVDFVLEGLWRERGSAATLIVAAVTSRGGTTRCRVATVGDCLLLVSEPAALASFPLRSSGEFTNRPETVRTSRPELQVESWACNVPAGSMLALASDAIGAWLLRRLERAGPRSVHAWLRSVAEPELPDVDDDVTLLVLDVPAARRRRVDRLLRLLGRARRPD
jgi:hypothetical protein